MAETILTIIVIIGALFEAYMFVALLFIPTMKPEITETVIESEMIH